MGNTTENNLDVNKYIADFWKANDMCNFTKEATVLFFYLIFVWDGEKRPEEFYMHPASLLCKVRGFTTKSVLDASDELQQRGYISFKAPQEQWCSGKYKLHIKKD
jgi:hypothetical protein